MGEILDRKVSSVGYRLIFVTYRHTICVAHAMGLNGRQLEAKVCWVLIAGWKNEMENDPQFKQMSLSRILRITLCSIYRLDESEELFDLIVRIMRVTSGEGTFCS